MQNISIVLKNSCVLTHNNHGYWDGKNDTQADCTTHCKNNIKHQG